MYHLINKIKSLFVFSCVFAAALGFPLSLIISRTFFSGSGLEDVILLQIDTAFFAFLIQAGARAGFKKAYITGYCRLVDNLELYIITKCTYVLLPFSFIFWFIGYEKFPFLYGINAILTLSIGLFLVKRDVYNAAKYSFLLFFINFQASLLLILFDNVILSSGEKVLIIDLGSALVYMLCILRTRKIKFSSAANSFRLLKVVLNKYVGLQISSLFIMLSAYIYAKSILMYVSGKPSLLFVYSDAIVVSGVTLMFISRVMMLFEKSLVQNGFVKMYVVAIHLFLFCFSVVCSFVYGAFYGFGLEFFLIVLGLLGKFSHAQTSAFIDEKHRGNFVFGAAFFVLIQFLACFLLFKSPLSLSWEYFLLSFSIFVFSVLYLVYFILSKKRFVTSKVILK